MADLDISLNEGIGATEEVDVEVSLSSIRQSIKDALMRDLLTIKESSGYHLTINGVSKKFKDFDEIEINETPYVCMYSGTSRYDYRESTQVVSYDLTLLCYFHIVDASGQEEDVVEIYADKFLDDLMVMFSNNTNVEKHIIALEVSESVHNPFHVDNIGLCMANLIIEFAQ